MEDRLDIEEGIVYDDSPKGGGNFNPNKVTNPNNIWKGHLDNYKYLQFIHKSSKDPREKIQASKEMDTAQKKMSYWEKHPLFSKKTAEVHTKEANKKWDVKESISDEQLAELSQGRLKSYIRKAGKSAMASAQDAGVHLAADKDGREGSAKASQELTNKASKRLKGIASAYSKIKENSDLDENGDFGSAFKSAREKGLQVFNHNGKSYNTMKAGESSAKWKASMTARSNAIKDATPTGPGGRGRPNIKPSMTATGAAASKVGTPPPPSTAKVSGSASMKPVVRASGSASSSVNQASSSSSGSATMKPRMKASGSVSSGTPTPAKSSVSGNAATPASKVDVNGYVGSVSAAKPDLGSALAAKAGAARLNAEPAIDQANRVSGSISVPKMMGSQPTVSRDLTSALAAKAATMRADRRAPPPPTPAKRSAPSTPTSGLDVVKMMGKSTATPSLSSALAAKAASMRASMKKEDIENVTEISSDLAKKYIRKAADDIGDESFRRGVSNLDKNKLDRSYKKTSNRKLGIMKAVDKLTKANSWNVATTRKEEVEHVEEGMKLIHTHTSESGKKVAKVYKDSEWGEYRVKHYTDGKHHVKADYHTDDKEDAHGTAKSWLKEDAVLDEAGPNVNSKIRKLSTDGDIRSDYSSGDSTGHSVSKGIHTFRKSYYYTHGDTSSKYASHVSDALKSHGIEHTVVDHGQEYKPFRGGASAKNSSHFWVKIKPSGLKEDAEQIDEVGNTERGQSALRDYMRKSAKSYTKNDNEGDAFADAATNTLHRGGKMHKMAMDHAAKRWDKAHTRMIGLMRAGKRIKEDADVVDEGKTWKSDSEDGYEARKGVKDKVKKFAASRRSAKEKKEVQEDLSPEVRSLNKKKVQKNQAKLEPRAFE